MSGDGPETARQALRLRVQQARYLARGVLGLTFVHPAGEPLPAWTPGAHIDVVLPSGTTRSYSLCGPHERAEYHIAVLFDPAGRGASREIHERQIVGQILSVYPPTNQFELVEAAHYVFIAGGIGITPLMPMLRHVAATTTSWEMHYLGRSREAMSFLDELAGYADRQGGRLDIIPRDERERAALASILAAAPAGSAIYCCGPDALLSEIEVLAEAIDFKHELYLEHFGRRSLDSGVPVETAATSSSETVESGDLAPCDPNGPFQVEFRATGVTIDVAPGETILGCARKIRTGLTFSCTDGYCGTCETRVLAGVPDHRDSVLTDDEKAGNATMMICVGRSRTRRLVLDL